MLGQSIPALLTATLLIILSGKATAQRGNQSDWNVPPPLAPGSITKGDTEGRPGNNGTAILTITDVTAAIQTAGSFTVPELAAISTIAPAANQPEQPGREMIAALSDTPLPEIPEAPQLPERTIADAPEPPVAPVPLPEVPELPEPPQAPVGVANTTGPNTGILPLMPDVAQPAPLSEPPSGSILWNTPGLPEVMNFKLIN